jgi:protein-S-isoprenylcysteine O-methyltransferase Ste14
MNEVDRALLAEVAGALVAFAIFIAAYGIGRWMKRRHWARVAREDAESAASYKGADGHE